MEKPFVSILIDTYNHERFIEQAIVSVLEQDFPVSDREILVVDDGSTDRTPEIVRKFEPKVRLLRKENGGQASAFNAGIPECSGEIIALLDGDDWWKPSKLRGVCRAFEQEPAVGLVGHGVTQIYEDASEHTETLTRNPRFRINGGSGAKLFRLRKSLLGTSRSAYRSALLQQLLPVPETLQIEADEYLMTLAACQMDVLVLPEALTYYRLHSNNLYQMQIFDAARIRRKQRALSALANSLREGMARLETPADAIEVVVEVVEIEARQLRLMVDGGPPWETVRTERALYRIMHEEAPIAHRWFRAFTMLPAAILPAKTFYSMKRSFARADWYKRARRSFFPAPEASHVQRSWKTP